MSSIHPSRKLNADPTPTGQTSTNHVAKRRLSKQQRQRIADQPKDLTDLNAGLVTGHYGGEVEVVALAAIDSEPDLSNSERIRCHFRANLPTLVVGDRVYWHLQSHDEAGRNTVADDPENCPGVIEHLAERNTLLLRPRPYQDPKPVAANIDAIYIVVAVEPPPFTTLIDRYLIAAENAGLPVALIINKIDQLPQASASVGEELALIEALYPALGYPILHFSCEGDNDGALAKRLAGSTSILVGQSGVGKSSIINALSSTDVAATGDISSANTRGKHTTTTSRLYALQGRGHIIDSPGIREFGLWHLSPDAIVEGLPEFRALASECRFRDCNHSDSAGCAIIAAIEDGRIHASRASSYRQVLDSLEDNHRTAR